MRSKLLFIAVFISLLFYTKENLAQTPNLGTTTNFALFTAAGAFDNTGVTTSVTGDVGTNAGAFNAFPPGTLVGQKYIENA
ncbi:MAG: hypothetical protein Q7U08_07975, partial [Flavobacteriaceae bacterium]|nr:hypothetical protein [Flavobacteriaceae bacterium]